MSVCPDCRDAGKRLARGDIEMVKALHGCCPELKRQADPSLRPTDKLGSSRCDCQHGLVSLRVADR